MSQTETILERLATEKPFSIGAIVGSNATEGWRKDIFENGYAVVKGAVSEANAIEYRNEMMTWLENFNLGFDRNDLSTVNKDTLPLINEKGMCINYAVSHENFAWRIRQEPGVLNVFREIYGDDELIVSFDAINFGFPNRTDLPPNSPWPHQDQDPKRPGFRVMQGLVNLFPNGPNDGGLIVCRGAHALSEEFHKEMAWETPIPAWNPEWYGFTDVGQKWLKDRGCEWVKVCAEPGDLILWDSRTPHYNLSPQGEIPRFCVYTCYMPVKDVTQDELKKKKDAYGSWLATTHWPNCQVVSTNDAKRDGKLDPANRYEPLKKPVFSEEGFKLTGIPYIKTAA